MKIILSLFLGVFFLFGSPLQTYTDLGDAFLSAKKQNKKVLLFVYTSYCGWCSKMKETTLKDPAIVNFINKNYIFVSLNQDQTKLPEELIPKFVPTTFLLDSQTKKVLTYLPGFKPADDFIEDLKGY